MPVTGWCRVSILCAAVTALMTTAAFGLTPVVSAGKPVHAAAVFHGVIDASRVPQESFRPAIQRPRPMLNITGIPEKKMAQLKALARAHAVLPKGLPRSLQGTSPFLSSAKVFSGLADSATTCPYFGGCAPPDGAIAVNSNYEMEGVNTSFAVYTKTGGLVFGWPKNSVAFFNIPAPSPAGCDPAGAFTSDPRIFYDTNDKHWFASILEVEGQPLGNSCNNLSLYWVAVSATNNPNGTWFVYAFDMSLGSSNWADFTQTGYDNKQFCFSGNMFPFAGGGFQYGEFLCSNKKAMQVGAGTGYAGFTCPSIGGTCLDTIQPVKTQGSVASQPGVEYFVAAENIKFGGGACATGCSTWGVLDIPDTGGVGIIAPGTLGYSLPPAANEPGCAGCVNTDDPRISGTPVYRAGGIWAAQNTAINNGTTTVSGILWSQFMPTLDSSSLLVTGGFFTQASYLFFSGDTSAYYGAEAADENNNMAMAWSASSSSLDPSTWASSRRVSDGLDTMRCCVSLQKGLNSTFSGRYGDYNSAASNEDPSDNIWVEAEVILASTDWGTTIARIVP